MKSIVLLGGASSSGKSSVVDGLLRSFDCQAVRPSNSYLVLASQRGVPDADAFTVIPAEDAEDHYLAACAAHRFTVSDLHFAVQPRRDSARAVGLRVEDEAEPYLGTLSTRLLSRLRPYRMLFVLLTAPPEVLFDRATERDGVDRRAVSIEDVQREAAAERREFEIAAAIAQASSITIDSHAVSTRQAVEAIGRLA